LGGKSSSCTIACCGFLTSNQVSIYTTHIKKVITKLYFFILRSTTTNKQRIRNFAWHRTGFGLN